MRLHLYPALVRHRASRDSRSISIPNLPDSTINVPFFKRPKSVAHFSRVRSSVLDIRAFGHFHLLEQRTFARRTWTTTPMSVGVLGRSVRTCKVQRLRYGQTFARSTPAES